MTEILRLCDKCLKSHLAQVEQFSKANPDATIDEWVEFWDRNDKWQLKRIETHCNPREPLHHERVERT